MKKAMCIFNIVVAVSMLVITAIGLGVHATHAYSTYVEFETMGVTFTNVLPQHVFDPVQRMKSIGDVATYYSLLLACGIGAAIANLFFWFRINERTVNRGRRSHGGEVSIKDSD